MSTRAQTAPRTNWAGNVAFNAREFHQPSTVAELQRIVAGADQVRALGTGHSFNTIADTVGVHVSIAGLPAVIDIDTAHRQVRIGAGVRFGELAAEIYARGWTLRNFGSLPHISVAGACATATHGSGRANGCIASAVSGLELVTADGDLTTLTAQDPDFAGCVVSLGGLGIATHLTLEVVPAFDVRQYVYEGLAWSALIGNLDEILDAAYSVSIFTDWSGGHSQIWLKQRLDAAGSASAGSSEAEPVPATWLGAQLATEALHPVPGMPVGQATEQLGVVGPAHERLPHFRLEFTPSNGEELQSEYLVAAADARRALTSLADLRADIAAVLQIGEIRTVAADELWLSPTYQRASVAIHFTWVDDIARALPVLRAVEARLAEFGARPHWGKIFDFDQAYLAASYPRFGEFQKLLHRFDPRGKLGNAYLDRYFF